MKTTNCIKQFWDDEDGIAAILWAISLVAVLGFVAVTYEIGKMQSLHSELQSFVDNVALAAAGELDGKADSLDGDGNSNDDGSINRATNAAQAMISDSHTFGTEDGTLSGAADYSLTFYSEIPADDTTALGGTTTTDDAKAAFVRVEAQPKTLHYTFLRVVNSLRGRATTDAQVSASAVAGYTQSACDISPLMFCLPPNWEDTLDIGDMILLRSGGSGGAWGPGNFGFIDLDQFRDASGTCSGSGNVLACMLAAQSNFTRCINTRGITTEPGQKVGITNAGFNTRFDMFHATASSFKNDEKFAPAPNVIKGIEPNGSGGSSCIGGNSQLTADTIALPRDTCMAGPTNTCGGNGRFGDGVWDRQGYLNVNHDVTSFDTNADGSGTDTHLPALSGDDTIYAGTRYGMYLREIAFGDTNPYSPPPLSDDILEPSLSETGRPQCSNKQSDDAKRRVVIAAGIDCNTTTIQGATTDVPVTQFVEVFLTEPVGQDASSPPSFDLHGEVIGFPDVAGGGSGGTSGLFRDIIQLYR